MAKKMYVGVSNKAKNIKAGYIGVDGKARKIKKVYVGVGGKAKLVWESTQYILTAPAQSGSLTYSGSEQTPSWDSNYLTSYMTLSVTAETNVGTYSATFTPKAGYGWTDGTTAAKSVSWSIGKKSITIPTVSNTSFTYNKSSQGPTVTNNSSTYITTTGASATAAGSYSITFTLKSTANTKWSDGTTAAKSTSWSIAKRKLTKPTLTNTSYTYDGGSKAPTINNYDSGYMTKSGTESSSTAGSYTITFKLSDTTNTTWSDSTTSNVSCSWTIDKISIDPPKVTNTSFTYNGSAKSPTITNSNYSTYITIGGTTSATNAGSYSITCTLKDTTNTQWSDGTTAQKSVGWKINKATYDEPDLDSTSCSFGSSDSEGTEWSTESSNYWAGDLTAYGYNDSNISVDLNASTDKIYITRLNTNSFSDSVRVYRVGDSNHNASDDAIITVSASAYNPLVVIDYPSNKTVTYNGETHWLLSSTEDDYINGDVSGVNAGTYEATLTPKTGYCWAGGSTSSITRYLYIEKADQSISASDIYFNEEQGNGSGDYTNVSGIPSGSYITSASAYSGDTFAVSITHSHTSVNVDRIAEDAFSTYVIVHTAATSNYNAGSCTFEVSGKEYNPWVTLPIGQSTSSISLSTSNNNAIVTFYAQDSYYTGGFNIDCGSYIGYEVEQDDGNSITIRVIKNGTGTGSSYISVTPADSNYDGYASCSITVS